MIKTFLKQLTEYLQGIKLGHFYEEPIGDIVD